MDTFRNILTAAVVALLVGVAAGWLRYWLGFLVIFHGAICAGLIGWLFHLARPSPPLDVQAANARVWRWSLALMAVFWAGQLLGTGLAQPWFEPLSHFADIASGSSVERFLAMGSVRAYGGGMSGAMWVFSVLLDGFIMWILLAVAVRDDEPRRRRNETKGDEP